LDENSEPNPGRVDRPKILKLAAEEEQLEGQVVGRGSIGVAATELAREDIEDEEQAQKGDKDPASGAVEPEEQRDVS
jgi:hypothetical protein